MGLRDDPAIYRRLALGIRLSLARLKRRSPTAYWWARNGAALVAWYYDRLKPTATGRAGDAYDESFWAFHDTGDWKGFAGVITGLFAPASVADVGCGHGVALQALAELDPAVRLQGFDNSTAGLRRAGARRIPVERLDVAALSSREADAMAARLSGFELVLCLEVAEHLPSWHGRTLLRLLSGAPRIVFSAAHPNQGGRLHVNEQPAEYWIRRFRSRGFELSPRDQALREAVATLALPPWYGQNIHVFERETRS